MKEIQMSAIDMLKEDHEKVKALFKQFVPGLDPGEKDSLLKQISLELSVHALLEEELFYPVLAKQLGKTRLARRARDEHNQMKIVLAQLGRLCVREDAELFDERVRDLRDKTLAHIEEEEAVLFPEVENARVNLVDLGEQLVERKAELKGVEDLQRVRADAINTESGAEPAAAAPRSRMQPEHG